MTPIWGTFSAGTARGFGRGGVPPLLIDYLVIAGGAGAISNRNGGGGAGGYRTATGYSVTSGSAITVTIGAGGIASTNPRGVMVHKALIQYLVL